jgi:hypothetical protein
MVDIRQKFLKSGLKFEPNARIGQKGAFFKGPNMKAGGTMSSNFIPPPALKRNI